MNILAIDTATECCSVAIKIDQSSTDQLKEITRNSHSKLVLGMVEELLKKNNITLNEIDLIAVDIGPGSFTGLRIGIGVAQGLAYTSNISTVGITSLQALASSIVDENIDFIMPAIDARMKQIYWGIYCKEAVKELTSPHVNDPSTINIESITSNQNKKIATIGSGWDVYQAALYKAYEGSIMLEHTANQFPEAEYIAYLASLSTKENYIPAKRLCAAYIRNDIVR